VEDPSERRDGVGDGMGMIDIDRPGSQKNNMPRKKAQGMGRGLFMGKTRNYYGTR
jgi:hypothetical protein